MRRLSLFAGAWLMLAAGAARADDEASNQPYVRSSQWGQFYAKSVPKERYGLRGTTTVYKVEEGQDTPLYVYDWYSPELYVEGFPGMNTVYVVQMGPWARGHQATPEHLALALYKNDALVKAYSTLDIAGTPENVEASVSHYQVFGERVGFRRPWGNQLFFDIERPDGELLTFHADTGELLTQERQDLLESIAKAQMAIGQLKWQWYQANKTRVKNADKQVLDAETLSAMAPSQFPVLPAGYRYVPDSVWTPVRIEETE